MRIAMWSGPRNLSTAMMYSFGVRDDFAVVDEPFYATYLDKTGLEHPMRPEILASQSTDPNRVISQITGSIPGEKSHFYQKHMTQHMVKGVPRDWLSMTTNVFLIRHPARVIASYSKKRQFPTADDIGFWQQEELFDHAVKLGQTPIVLDSADIRKDPRAMLTALCRALGLKFQDAMLTWPKGGHKDDGVWARHWYGEVHKSSGFAGPEGPLPDLPNSYMPLLNDALPHYKALARYRLVKPSDE